LSPLVVAEGFCHSEKFVAPVVVVVLLLLLLLVFLYVIVVVVTCVDWFTCTADVGDLPDDILHVD